jgi:hypothetical protein
LEVARGLSYRICPSCKFIRYFYGKFVYNSKEVLFSTVDNLLLLVGSGILFTVFN